MREPPLLAAAGTAIPTALRRESTYLTHPVFATHHSETAMMRYLKRLADMDYGLDRGMIPLGSCTMKLNAARRDGTHLPGPPSPTSTPFAPADQTPRLADPHVDQLETWLAEVCRLRRRLRPTQRRDPKANSPASSPSAPGRPTAANRAATSASSPPAPTAPNASSAVLAGLRVVVVACDEAGNVDLADLEAKIATHADRLAALMVTYPSTHGVYEETIVEVCARVHDAGGQVYVDGANLNALLGWAKPGRYSDVSHLNLHKTFCIPHGGGGPGVGPVAVAEHLVPFLPSDPMGEAAGPVGPVSRRRRAPWRARASASTWPCGARCSAASRLRPSALCRQPS